VQGLILYLLIFDDKGEGRALLPFGLNLNAVVIAKPQFLREFLALIQSDAGAGLIDVLGGVKGREKLEQVFLLLHFYA